jgi:hypothetical protein
MNKKTDLFTWVIYGFFALIFLAIILIILKNSMGNKGHYCVFAHNKAVYSTWVKTPQPNSYNELIQWEYNGRTMTGRDVIILEVDEVVEDSQCQSYFYTSEENTP